MPSGDRLLTVHRSGRILSHRWHPLKPSAACPFTLQLSDTPIGILPLTKEGTFPGEYAHALKPCYAISADGRWLLCGGRMDGSLNCFSLSRLDICKTGRMHSAAITCIHVGKDGNTLVTGSQDTTLVVWDLYGECRGHLGITAPVATSLNGNATNSFQLTGNVGLAANPCPLYVLHGHVGSISCVSLSTELGIILSGTKYAHPSSGTHEACRNCILWDSEKGRLTRCLAVTSSVDQVAISCASLTTLVLTSNDKQLRGLALLLFSINGTLLHRVGIETPQQNIVCTRDGDLMITPTENCVIVRKLSRPSNSTSHPISMSKMGSKTDSFRIEAFAMSPQNHHAFAVTSGGGLLVFANPMMNIIVLERLAGELLNL